MYFSLESVTYSQQFITDFSYLTHFCVIYIYILTAIKYIKGGLKKRIGREALDGSVLGNF